MARKPFDPADIMADVHRAVDQDIQRTGLRVLTAVTLGTPVGNPTLWQNPESAPPGYVGGHARRNWNVSVGAANDAELAGTDASGAATITAGQAALQGYRGSRQGVRVFIQNPVPYMGRLNDGHSTQAPAGFIERGVAAVSPPSSVRVTL